MFALSQVKYNPSYRRSNIKVKPLPTLVIDVKIHTQLRNDFIYQDVYAENILGCSIQDKSHFLPFQENIDILLWLGSVNFF